METVSRIKAVQNFLSKDAQPISTKEFADFWKACSEAEKAEFAEQSAKMLGVQLAIVAAA